MVTHKSEYTDDAAPDGYRAIADPTRRAILDHLRHEELSAGDLARRFPISRPAIARHVGVLKRARLIRERRVAQSRRYSLDPEGLRAIDDWLAPYRVFWSARLTDLKSIAEEMARNDKDEET